MPDGLRTLKDWRRIEREAALGLPQPTGFSHIERPPDDSYPRRPPTRTRHISLRRCDHHWYSRNARTEAVRAHSTLVRQR